MGESEWLRTCDAVLVTPRRVEMRCYRAPGHDGDHYADGRFSWSDGEWDRGGPAWNKRNDETTTQGGSDGRTE